ncbi:hypothetical protein F0562_025069 [Nyssa sinensis]|uniref:Uncharacterized protein n=1 Tax=Nyssa sinensis TaxID=561372 RepID=A0A5J5BER0_9ASTE|nr:hypothetical protein F0562_025069 [Nyssa sinensis]
MESSQIFGGAEECHSSESGWTMYIGSPIHGDDDGDDHSTDDGDEEEDDKNANHEDDSDDSMASDASSGPSHREHPWRNGEGGHGMAQYKHQEDKGDVKHCSYKKKAKNPVEKKGNEKRKGEKEESLFTAKGANVSIQSDARARKNSWTGQRKPPRPFLSNVDATILL